MRLQGDGLLGADPVAVVKPARFAEGARHILAKSKAGVAKISKALKRTIGATAVKAHMLGVSLDTRG